MGRHNTGKHRLVKQRASKPVRKFDKRTLWVVPAVLAMTLTTTSATAAPSPDTKRINVYLTGYSWQDNNPPGSPDICCQLPGRPDEASGDGTFTNPITVAVPGSSGRGMEWPRGTKFYLARLQRYLIVEDSGASPSKDGFKHLDVWIDGRDGSRSNTDDCMSELTGKTPATVNPPPGFPVIQGPIYNGGCRIPGNSSVKSFRSNTDNVTPIPDLPRRKPTVTVSPAIPRSSDSTDERNSCAEN